MKEEALKLADELQDLYKYSIDDVGNRSADMIRKLVAELDKQGEPVFEESNEQVVNAFYKQFPEMKPQTKPLSDDEILNMWIDYSLKGAEGLLNFAKAIEKAHGIV